MQFFNVGLAKNPFNWGIIFLMLLFAAIAGHLFLSLVGVQPATNNS